MRTALVNEMLGSDQVFRPASYRYHLVRPAVCQSGYIHTRIRPRARMLEEYQTLDRVAGKIELCKRLGDCPRGLPRS